MKTLYLDVETTGLDPVKNDIIQIAGIIEIEGEMREDFSMYCQPFSYDNISEESFKIHGHSIEQIREFDEPGAVFNRLIKIFDRYVNRYNKKDKFYPAGQNVRFDINFLRQFFVKNDDKYFGSWFNSHCIDLLSLTAVLKYAGKIDIENLKLEVVANYFGITFDSHNAMDDIRITRDILRMLIDDYLK